MSKIGKNAMINNKWQWVELDEKQAEEALEELLKNNEIQLKLCMQKVSGMEVNTDNKLKLAMALFDKQGTASYTILNNKLDQKISAMKNKVFFKSFKGKTFKEAEKTAEKELEKEPKTISEKSVLNEAFQKAGEKKEGE